MLYQFSADSRINNRGLSKPNEDIVLADADRQICFVLDGITRVHQEYADHPGHSAALEVGRIFSTVAYAYLCDHGDLPPEQLLREAAAAGNAALRPYRQQRAPEQWQFYPGTLGILAMIRYGRLHYVYNGDCMGTLLRNGEKIHFGRQEQTKILEERKISKSERYAVYCNHPEHPLGYGIFNGDAAMESLLEYGLLELQPGDVILLCTDGLADYIRYTDAERLAQQTPGQILDASGKYDAPPYATYADDKTILRISVERRDT